MDGSALVIRGAAGGVVGVAADPPVLPDAAICGLCAEISPRPASVTTAQAPVAAAHSLSFAVILTFVESDLSHPQIPFLRWESAVNS